MNSFNKTNKSRTLLHSKWLWFTLFVVVNVIFKSLYLDSQGFWYDEILSLHNSQRHWGHIKHISEWDPNPPLYFYFIHVWRNLFGIGEFAIRFSSVLFSALAGGCIYLFVRKNYSSIAGLVSALLFLCSDVVYYQAHEARPYSLILFLTVISCSLFFDLLNKPVLWRTLLLGLINFCLIYTHYLSGYVVFCQLVIIIALWQRKQTINYVYSLGFVLLLMLWRFTKKTILLVLGGNPLGWLTKPDLKTFLNALTSFYTRKELLIVALLIMVLAFALIFIRKEKNDRLDKLKIAFFLLCGPFTFVFFYFLSNITPVFLERYMMFSFVSLCVLFSLSIVSLFKNNVIIVLFTILFATYSVFMIDLNKAKPMDYKGAVGFIKQFKNEKTIVLVESIDVEALFAYYYDKTIFSDFDGMHKKLNEVNVYALATKADLSFVPIDKAEEIIVTQTYVRDEGVSTIIPKEFKLIEITERFHGVKIFYYRRIGE